MIVNGSTRLVGLIGQRIPYSLSPLIHNTAAKMLHKNCVYVPCDVPSVSVKNLLGTFWDMGAVGFNVTTPHKNLVASLVPGHHLESVNTLYRGTSGWQAASTDGEGFARALDRMGTPLSGYSKVVFLGNGGVVMAIMSYMVHELEGQLETVILRRNATRDHIFRKMMPENYAMQFLDFTPMELKKELSGRSGDTLLVQATDAPLRGDDLRLYTPALEGFHGMVADLVYGKPSALLQKAKEMGLLCQDGLSMLIEQARLSQQFWWQESAPFESLVQVVQTYIKNASQGL